MPTYKGRWMAKVEQEFEIDAQDEEDFHTLVEQEMSPRSVVELHDFEYEVDAVIEDAPSN